jgi:hypothetical protein
MENANIFLESGPENTKRVVGLAAGEPADLREPPKAPARGSTRGSARLTHQHERVPPKAAERGRSTY